jgi:hypothetical protein
MKFACTLLTCALVLTGCAKEEPKPKPGGVEVNAPGVNIKIGPDGGAEVKAPGTEVKVKPK